MRMYDNPVIGGFHPDPSVCRVGEDYYLVCSSFEYVPGVPLFHSRDLVHWRQIGNVLDRPGQLELADDVPASAGIYAPTIRHHDGRFYMITTAVGDIGNFIVTAERPEGPWSDPIPLGLPGIDPDLAWDEDGTCWCTLAGVSTARIDPLSGRVLEGPFRSWSGTGFQHPEAPHLYRIGEWWYLLIAEGGTDRGHGVSIARARTPRGPFESCPANPILTHRSTDLPVQSTGHADLVSAPDGTWWMVLLGTRPRGGFPRYHVLGRETFLTPVQWRDGWPEVGPVQERHPAPAAWHPLPPAPERDDFDGPELAPHWISPRRRPANSFSLDERPGTLTLTATGPSLDRPGHTFVGRRQQHPDCRAAVRLEPGTARCGLSVRMDEAHHYDLEVHGGEASVIARIGPLRQVVARHPVPPGPLTLTLDIRTGDVLPPTVTTADQATGEPLGVGAHAPDTLAFSLGGPDPVPLAELDGRYLSTEVGGGFTGRVIGMYVTDGSAAFDWFDYAPTTVSGPGDTARDGGA
ncbi:glycoside hydrolase family 43 protein [Streptomyces odontomachi]|uniref:glycoside hydrolase family 43 protein n=1 Tax=Streptomyces odontomachi TaxID=2944940 RepID=UPI002109389E|nr:glycoside hydrolase family 43 protein [Streptomyces sp. ODS25]